MSNNEEETFKYTPIDQNFELLEKELLECKKQVLDVMVKFRKLRKEFRKYGKQMENKPKKKTKYQELYAEKCNSPMRNREAEV